MIMKQIKFFLFVVSLCFFFVACDKDNNGDEPENPDTGYKVVYEASVSDPVNYKIRVAYMGKNDTKLKEEVVESPFSYEMKDLKKGAYLYISTQGVPRNVLVSPDKNLTCRIIINDKLHEEANDGFSAIIQYVLGTPKE